MLLVYNPGFPRTHSTYGIPLPVHIITISYVKCKQSIYDDIYKFWQVVFNASASIIIRAWQMSKKFWSKGAEFVL